MNITGGAICIYCIVYYIRYCHCRSRHCEHSNLSIIHRVIFRVVRWSPRQGAGLNGGLFSETMDFRDFPSVLSAVRIAQS